MCTACKDTLVDTAMAGRMHYACHDDTVDKALDTTPSVA